MSMMQRNHGARSVDEGVPIREWPIEMVRAAIYDLITRIPGDVTTSISPTTLEPVWRTVEECWLIRIELTDLEPGAPAFELTWNGRSARYRCGERYGFWDGDWFHFRRRGGQWEAWDGRWIDERELMDGLIEAAGVAMAKADETTLDRTDETGHRRHRRPAASRTDDTGHRRKRKPEVSGLPH